MCTAVDIALNKGGCEAVVEGFYSVMKAQHMGGRQSNDTLEKRAIIDWIYPTPIKCDEAIMAASRIFADGTDRDVWN
jgi:hypothetical protein